MLVDIHTNLFWYPDHLSEEFVESSWAAKRAKMRLTGDVHCNVDDTSWKHNFDCRPEQLSENDAVFPVESYLQKQGQRFASRWRPERFLALSLSGDLHGVNPSAIRTPAVFVAAEDDAIVPREQLETLARELGADCRLVDLPSRYGHDAFLTEPDALGIILRNALTESILS